MTQLSPDLILKAQKYLSKEEDFLLNDMYKVYLCIHDSTEVIDFSFLTAPAAKAYEGFLKDFFLQVGLIDENQYKGDRFRVGKTLNPSLRYKRFSIYKRLSEIDDTGEQIAEVLWSAWKQGRNETLHYFPHNLKKLTCEEAVDRIHLILQAITMAGDFLTNFKQQ